MEQRRYSATHYGYFESQVSHPVSSAAAHEAALPDPFLPELFPLQQASLAEKLLPLQSALTASRTLAILLLPDDAVADPLLTLTTYDRLSTALTVAQVTGQQRLCRYYASRLAPLPGPDSSRESNIRLAQITQYARQLASQPALITAKSVQQLEQVGLTAADIVTFHQIIGFVSYQARVNAVLQAAMSLPLPWLPPQSPPPDADRALFGLQADWQARIESVELRYASAQQLEALTWCQPQPAFKHIAWLLAHDAPALYHWAALQSVLLPAAAGKEADVVTLVVSRINGSPHCFHAVEHSLRAPLYSGITTAQAQADQTERALMDASALLTRSPERFCAKALQALRDGGCPESTLLPLLFHAALVNWRNRLMQTLGE